MLIAAIALLTFVLFLICCFLHIDVKRAVLAKEAWKNTAIASYKERKVLGDRGARLMSVIQTNNAHYQDLSDKLEDTELALAFEKERGVNDERAIKYWMAEWQTALDAWREERRKLVGRLSRLDVRNNTIGALLEVPEADRDQPGALAERTKEVVDDLRATKGLLDAASEEIQALVTARDEATALLVASQQEAAELAKEREDLIRERDEIRAQVDAVSEALQQQRFGAGPLRVREFVASKGVVLTSLRTKNMDLIVQELDDLSSSVQPAPASAEDIAPPAKRPRRNKVPHYSPGWKSAGDGDLAPPALPGGPTKQSGSKSKRARA